ncbi:translation initiation factor IF-2 subunit beta [Halorarum halophilum]|uniref:Translation initiation factor IF-2 subunit beta n=1 Tax=Halorarum halophilum TaxID=2743090 RepID=A0A7D5GWA6_9EURY|nr:translation initiation factor IF-2 subunit beta [Halobaculum halophilum]QLG26749.1 translation initiation factor IF-2 subunit beta [Halobaculum halophilum]
MAYDDMLDRAVEEAPEIDEGESRFAVPDPEVRPEGNVTVFENFRSVADTLGREPEHLLQFIQNELGTSAGIDERGRARFTGDFRQWRVGDAVDEYTEAFVICPECGLPDTKLVTERGEQLLKCDACGARSPTPE